MSSIFQGLSFLEKEFKKSKSISKEIAFTTLIAIDQNLQKK
jgi:hypothetical protein